MNNIDPKLVGDEARFIEQYPQELTQGKYRPIDQYPIELARHTEMPAESADIPVDGEYSCVLVGNCLPTEEQLPRDTKNIQPSPVKRRSPSKLPGYVEPGRKGTVGLTAHIAPELRDAVNAVARLSGRTTQAFLSEVLYGVVQQMYANGHLDEAIAATLEQYAATRPPKLQAPLSAVISALKQG